VLAIQTVIVYSYGVFEVIEPTGPYGVGHRFEPISKNGVYINVSTYYPIDKKEFDQRKFNIRDTSLWFVAKADGIKMQSSLYGQSTWSLQEVLCYRVEAINDAELHKEFRNKDKMLTPIVVSHGLASLRTLLSVYATELASYG
jgi:hypothetical protein